MKSSLLPLVTIFLAYLYVKSSTARFIHTSDENEVKRLFENTVIMGDEKKNFMPPESPAKRRQNIDFLSKKWDNNDISRSSRGCPENKNPVWLC